MNNWSLAKKIWTCVGVLIAAYVVNNGLSIRTSLVNRRTLNEITGTVVKRDQLVADIRDSQRRISLYLMEIIARKDEANKTKFTKLFDKSRDEIRKHLEAYRALATPSGRDLLTNYEKVLDQYLAIADPAAAKGREGLTDQAFALMASGDQFRDQMRDVIIELSKFTTNDLNAASAEADRSANASILMNILIATLSILASITLTILVMRQVTRSISEVIKNLTEGSTLVNEAAAQIAGSSETLSQSATEEAAALQQTAASVEEMNSMVAKNVENARATERTSNQSQNDVNVGKAIVKRMIAAMEEITASSRGLAETVKVIEQIDKKTKVINDIVNKTELLSFNASVEAARAGEHGKGFAVVAEEVGNLARSSGAAAEDIATLLEASLRKVNELVHSTSRSVEAGTQVTMECGKVFETIVGNVERVSGMASEISSASQEQSRGISEITKAMNQLDQMTQQNAATSEECAGAAEELSAQATTLRSAVEHLVAVVEGARGRAAYPASPAFVHAAPKTNVVPFKLKRKPMPGATRPPTFDSAGFSDV